MEISPYGGINFIQQIWTDISTALDAAGVEKTEEANDDFSSPAKMEMSNLGEILSRLQQLAESDPDKFKELMNECADRIEAKAVEMDEDDPEAGRLDALAERFRSAAESGDVSQLRPPRRGGPPPGGGMGMGIQQYQSQSEDEEDSLLELLTQAENEVYSDALADVRELLLSLLSNKAGNKS